MANCISSSDSPPCSIVPTVVLELGSIDKGVEIDSDVDSTVNTISEDEEEGIGTVLVDSAREELCDDIASDDTEVVEDSVTENISEDEEEGIGTVLVDSAREELCDDIASDDTEVVEDSVTENTSEDEEDGIGTMLVDSAMTKFGVASD